MRAFIYTRNAEPNPAQQRRQYEQCKTVAEEHHYEVVGTGHDDGHHRSGLATLIEQLRARDIDIVLTVDHASLGASVTTLAAMMKEIHRANARLFTCLEPGLPESVSRILVDFASWETR